MKRNSDSNNSSYENLIRTTIFMPTEIDENLGALALQKGTSKAELVREAARDFIIKNNLNPDKKPIIEIKVAY